MEHANLGARSNFGLFKELRWAVMRCGRPQRKLSLCNIGRQETKAKQEAIKFYYSDGSSLYCAGSESFYWTQHPRLHRHAFNARVESLHAGGEEDPTWLGRARGRVQRGGGEGNAIRRDVFSGNSEGLVAFNEMWWDGSTGWITARDGGEGGSNGTFAVFLRNLTFRRGFFPLFQVQLLPSCL